ncbi:gamma-aminobutyraldehyde dehydrogenase [Amycolatopsis panacis]|uniref:Gamma-aminobutyraldehyde dehydrogenase n=1 Tax=Amycolatopsis panacis TaxID=2340917 RepID=A0A419IBC2_9PSEU|nr:gamma-aminobutyraldehyde dehydrogenase [Amycolatopsis panacis]RJQ91309.1 gamma-aminobutyraldehyde dehydrogenase [Amycolatopsis panacis]
MTFKPAGSHYLDGGSGDGRGPECRVVDPATGDEIWTFTADSPAEVEAAIAAASAASPGWSTATPGERSGVLLKLAAELESFAGELAEVETAQAGKPIRLSRQFDVPGSLDNVAFFAGAARLLEGSASAEYSPEHTSSIRREAIGVVGSIAPWNYPLQMAVWKVLPAIAAGNTIVLKPSEITPITTLMLAQACSRAGVPDGVVNVVNGPGAVTGEALVTSRSISMMSFTGSTAVGRHIAGLAAANGTRLHLELGGKAPFVVFDDADLPAAIRGAVAAALINSGQDCTAATRAYVHRSLFTEFVDGVAALMSQVRLGDTGDEDTDLGPLVSWRQRDRVAAMVERARNDGARIVVGGGAPGGELSRGAYYAPTLITDADQRSEIVQEEVFGPVLTALPFDDDTEAIRLANDVRFGLAASAWTRDVFRAQNASRLIKAGTVWINDHIPIISEMPHGGMKGSGYGKDMSAYALDDYTQLKHVMSDITGAVRKPWHNTVLQVCEGTLHGL